MKKQSSNGGFWLVVFLVALFAFLKLSGFVSWSWLWVFSPLWISCLLGLAVVLIGALVARSKSG